MTHPIRIALAGLGTVGTGVVKMIQTHGPMLAARAGQNIEIRAVSARSKSKDRGVDLSAYDWEDDPVALARRDDIDILIEVMGGEDGPAKAAVETALGRGIHVITANKAMLAHHGQALAELGEKNGASLRFEAAVAGGIPCVKALTEGLAGNQITRVMGVMNGTCNYILTQMEDTGADYLDVLKDAQELGYAEADPAFDVGGIDAAHKLALLAATAFGSRVDFDGVKTEGIDKITLTDIQHAADMGYAVKLLGVARLNEDGLEQRMQPCLVPKSSGAIRPWCWRRGNSLRHLGRCHGYCARPEHSCIWCPCRIVESTKQLSFWCTCRLLLAPDPSGPARHLRASGHTFGRP